MSIRPAHRTILPPAVPPLIERQPAPRSAQESLQPLRCVVGVTQAWSNGSAVVLGLGEGVLAAAGEGLLLVSEGGGPVAALGAGKELARPPVSWCASSPKALTAADSWSVAGLQQEVALAAAAAGAGAGRWARRAGHAGVHGCIRMPALQHQGRPTLLPESCQHYVSGHSTRLLVPSRRGSSRLSVCATAGSTACRPCHYPAGLVTLQDFSYEDGESEEADYSASMGRWAWRTGALKTQSSCTHRYTDTSLSGAGRGRAQPQQAHRATALGVEDLEKQGTRRLRARQTQSWCTLARDPQTSTHCLAANTESQSQLCADSESTGAPVGTQHSRARMFYSATAQWLPTQRNLLQLRQIRHQSKVRCVRTGRQRDRTAAHMLTRGCRAAADVHITSARLSCISQERSGDCPVCNGLRSNNEAASVLPGQNQTRTQQSCMQCPQKCACVGIHWQQPEHLPEHHSAKAQAASQPHIPEHLTGQPHNNQQLQSKAQKLLPQEEDALVRHTQPNIPNQTSPALTCPHSYSCPLSTFFAAMMLS